MWEREAHVEVFRDVEKRRMRDGSNFDDAVECEIKYIAGWCTVEQRPRLHKRTTYR